jgi:hypothetical protein
MGVDGIAEVIIIALVLIASRVVGAVGVATVVDARVLSITFVTGNSVVVTFGTAVDGANGNCGQGFGTCGPNMASNT